MQGVTKIRAVPGVVSASDLHASAVVDTINDRWLYLTDDRARVWKAIELSGDCSGLTSQDITHLHFFVRHNLVVLDDHPDTIAHGFVHGPDFVASILAPPNPAKVNRPIPPPYEIQRAWRWAAFQEKVRTRHIMRRVRKIHLQTKPYLDAPSLHLFREAINQGTPQWAQRAGCVTERSVSVATAYLAHRANARADVAFGMSHETYGRVWWSWVPSGECGRTRFALLVSCV